MTRGDVSARAVRGSLLLACALTVVAAVMSDVAAGERPVHTALLAAVAALVGVVRVRMAGRHGGLFAALSGSVVAQPVVHAGSKALHPLTSPDHAPGGAGSESYAHALGADASMSLAHLVLAVAVVALVTSCEQVLLLLAGTLRRLRWRLRAPSPQIRLSLTPSAASVAPRVGATYRTWARHMGRRGPPDAVLATA